MPLDDESLVGLLLLVLVFVLGCGPVGAATGETDAAGAGFAGGVGLVGAAVLQAPSASMPAALAAMVSDFIEFFMTVVPQVFGCPLACASSKHGSRAR